MLAGGFGMLAMNVKRAVSEYSTVPNLLAFGELAPRYHANVVRVTLRYRF